MARFYREDRFHNVRRTREREPISPETKRALGIIFLCALGVLSVLAFFDLAGLVGKTWRLFLATFFGRVDVLVPLLILAIVVHEIFPDTFVVKRGQWWGVACLIVALIGLFHLRIPTEDALAVIGEERGGGYLGLLVSYPLRNIAGIWGALVILFALGLAGLILIFETSIAGLFAPTRWGLDIITGLREWLRKVVARWQGRFGREAEEGEEVVFSRQDIEEGEEEDFSSPAVAESPRADEGEGSGAHAAAHPHVYAAPRPLFPMPRRRRKVEVPLELLTGKAGKPTSGDISANQETIRKTFANFGIEVEMGEVSVGPTVTQYTLRPAEGVKVSQITSLSNDVALALAAHPIRIEAPIPGKSLVGIEVPNQQVAVVPLREVLMSEEFKKRNSTLTIAIGKDVAGKPWLADVGKMPHLLIAGATGSGKSVMINSCIVSLLFQNQPDDLRFILVDPKRVELTVYNGLPHLLTPVVTEVDRTINALRWVVGEMDRRFQLLSETGKRNIEVYNSNGAERLPYIVVVIDELADLMSVAAAEVEAAIIRLAQMARAVGIHLIVATQRPSVDIITGLIKANITSRIAFAVASAVDSRTILDVSGAERLLGRGDLLFTTAELSKPRRLQGAYVSDEEIERVAAYWKEKWGEPSYDEEVIEKRTSTQEYAEGDEEGDTRLAEARELVVRAGKASASFLQRRMSVGYARAARLLDLLEEEGTIGPGEGAKPRDVLLTIDELPSQDYALAEGEEERQQGQGRENTSRDPLEDEHGEE
ncbi:MAG: DNA translocase FtsK 4TM domain-containing protein [Patescibacteria group bacterium]